MRTFFRFLWRNKLYSAINIVGLAVSMAFVLLLASYAAHQFSVDSFQENASRIYAIGDEEDIISAYYLNRYVAARYPEIEASAAFASGENEEFLIDGNKFVASVACADSSFFDMFSFGFTQGDKEAFKFSIDNIVVSESFARKVFPGLDPVGRTVTLRKYGEDFTFTVVAVMKDISGSVIPYKDVFMRGEWMERFNGANDPDMSNAGSCVTFIMVYPGMDILSKKDDMLEYFKGMYWTYENGLATKVELIPLDELYFYENQTEWSGLETGNRSLVMLLIAVCTCLLVFAVLNYVNLTTAQSGFRAKEMAMRSLLGDRRGVLFLSMIRESTFLCAVSMLLAVFIAQWLSPAASQLIEYDFSMWGSVSFSSVALVVALTLVLGFLAGFIPAVTISNVRAIDIVRGTFRKKTKSIYGKIMIGVQNFVTIAMVAVALTMQLQYSAVVNAPLGYNTEDILNVRSEINFADSRSIYNFRNELLKLSCVESVGFGYGTPLYGSNNSTNHYNGGMVSFQQIQGDSAYFNILGLRIKQDNHLATEAWWLNEYAFKELGIGEDALYFTVGTESWSDRYDIGGIYYDFKIRPVLYDQSAALIRNYGDLPEGNFPWNVLVKITGDPDDAYRQISEAYNRVSPDRELEASYIEDEIRMFMKDQQRVMIVVSVFTVLAIIVSSLGLLAISTYYVRQERKSIALRKIMGSSRRQMLWRILSSFLAIVGVAFVAAVPVSYWLLSRWLEQFSYRIGLHWWIFAAAGIFTAVMAVLTVLWQTMKAVSENPTEALKTE